MYLLKDNVGGVWGVAWSPDGRLLASCSDDQTIRRYVTILRRSSEEQSILLAPDMLINLAASFMLKAQANEKGLGSLDEVRALRNDYHFQEVEALSEDERGSRAFPQPECLLP